MSVGHPRNSEYNSHSRASPLAVRAAGQVLSRDIRVALSDLPMRLYPSVMWDFGRFLTDIQVEPSTNLCGVLPYGYNYLRAVPPGHPRKRRVDFSPWQNLCCGYNDLRTVPVGHPRNSECNIRSRASPLAVRAVGQVRSRDIRVTLSNFPLRLYPSVVLDFGRFLSDIQVEPSTDLCGIWPVVIFVLQSMLTDHLNHRALITLPLL